MIVALLGRAFAQDGPSSILHDVMLDEALTGRLDEAVRAYQELSRNLPVEDPVRTQALLRLGLAHAELGQLDEARDALLEGIRSGSCNPCRIALEALEIERHAVTRLPTTWTFDGAEHGVFHPIDAQPFGTTRLEVGPGGASALMWRSEGRPGAEDHLVVGLSIGAERVRLVALSADAPGLLDLRVEDDRGRRWSMVEPAVFPAGTWQEVVVELRDLVPLEPGEGPPDPAALVRLDLRDRTGLRRGGPVTWWLDTLEFQ